MARKKTRPAPPRPRSVAAQVTDRLRKDVLARGEGEFLGKEEDMLARYGVSRPTFRQSVRMLEQEQLLEVKRGIAGGYYARKPGIKTVGRFAATYLESRGTTANQLIEAGYAATRETVKKAAESTDEVGRRALIALRQRLDTTDVCNQSFEDFHQLELDFRSCLHRLAGNPALELFVEVLYQGAMDEEGPGPLTFASDGGRRLDWVRLHLRLVDAILEREPKIADALVDSMFESLMRWRGEDHAGGE